MKPMNDAFATRTEAERRTRNFAFMAARIAAGTIVDNEIAILRGRDLYCYDWDAAVAYASGWTAADAG